MFILTFIRESFREFKLVTWLPAKALEQLLLLCFIGFSVCVVFIFATDYLLQKVQRMAYDLLVQGDSAS